MKLSSDALTADQAYKLLVGCVVPRPIAWITTRSKDGLINAAPFSAFTFVSNKPPMVAASIGRKAGVLKDTARNIMESGEFVVNIAGLDLLDQLHMSAHEYPDDVSETSVLAIDLADSDRVRVPRIAAAAVSLECTLHKVLEFGDMATGFFVGEVSIFHVRDGLLKDGKIDTTDLRPICRLGGPNYATLGNIITKAVIRTTPK